MKGTCPCGGVTVTVPGRPEYLNSCNCTLCWRLGGLWGYFDPAKVTEAMTDSLIAHYVPMVMGLWIVGCAIIWFYPITEAKHLANIERLRAREAEAKSREMQDAPLGAPAR